MVPGLKLRRAGAIVAPISVLTFAAYSVHSLIGADGSAIVIYVRWAASFLAMYLLIQSSTFRLNSFEPLLKGLVVGGLIAAVVSLLQSRGVALFISDDARFVTVNGNYRAVGVFEHPNANSHTTMLGAAAALQLALTKNKRASWWLFYVAISLITYTATETRAGLLVGLFLLIAYWLKTKANSDRVVLLAGGGAVAFAAFYLYGDALLQRWLGSGSANYFSDNADGRVSTIFGALAYIPALPFGFGVEYQRVFWETNFGLQGVHNGLLYGILVFGWWFAVLSTFFLRALPIAFLQRGALCSSLALVITAAFVSLMFEDLVVGPTFTAIVSLVVVVVCRDLALPKAKFRSGLAEASRAVKQ